MASRVFLILKEIGMVALFWCMFVVPMVLTGVGILVATMWVIVNSKTDSVFLTIIMPMAIGVFIAECNMIVMFNAEKIMASMGLKLNKNKDKDKDKERTNVSEGK
jgi:hypothetical protein